MTHEQRAQASYNQHRCETDPEWSDLPEPDRLACFSATEADRSPVEVLAMIDQLERSGVPRLGQEA